MIALTRLHTILLASITLYPLILVVIVGVIMAGLASIVLASYRKG